MAVTVTIPGGNAYSRTIGLTFQNGKGATNVPQTTITTSSLNGVPFGAPTGFANTTVTGGTYTESQTITLSNASGGTWRVAYNGEVSAPLSPTITAAQLKSTLDAFVGIDNVTVTGGSGSFTVTFGGTQSTTNMQQIFGDAANASNGSTLRTITTAYDAASQVASVSDPSSTINYTLDNLGRATTIAQSVNGLTPTMTLNQAFDAMNNRTELKATIASTLDFKNTYQFDALQRLTDIVQQGQSGGNAVTAKHVTQSFNALSQRTQIARYQSIGTTSAVATTDFTFDTANRLSGIAHKQGATNLNTYAYTYDPLSRIATIVSTLDGTDTYSYDQISQLVGATHTSQANETYGFDANGNRNTGGFTTGTNNQTTAGLGFTYTFDDEGNRTKRTETATGKVQEYDWDHRNRLIAVKDRDTAAGAIVRQVNYQYDAFNRLVRRDYDADGAGAGAATSQYWIYDEGINAVLQFDGSSASNLSHRYLWSDQVDDLLADEQVTSLSMGGNTLWGLADHLGSIRNIADQNESTGVTTIANHRRNNSFGQLISETNATVDMLFAFTGKQYDEATGLQHNLNRWYDPALGQWLSEDPIGFSAGDANLYRYVGNHPTYATDPSGLQEPKPKTTEESGAFDEFPELPGQGLPVKPVKPKSPEDSMNVSIDEFLIRLISMSDSSDSVVCKYGQGTSIADQLWKSDHIGLMKGFREWFETGADTYPIDTIKQNYDSGIKEIQYVAPAKDFLRDGFVYYFGLGHATIEHMGSFKIQYQATIDCERREARIRIRAYNAWSIESLTRNPVTRKSLVDGEDYPKVHMIIEIDKRRPLR